jgi:23S rRNA pseudouridine2605 synthase
MSQRVSKFLSRAGICSRRQAEQYISEERVKVDGHILLTPATLVDENSKIEVDGKLVHQPSSTRVWLYYKPLGHLTTHSDPQGRPTIFQAIQSHQDLPRVISVGRLDLNSEGLILLTNDGAFSRKAELPQTGWARCYKIRVFGQLNLLALKNLQQGITVDGVRYGEIQVEVLKNSIGQANHWLSVTLYEGKNREIRNIMRHLNLQVNRLIRQSYGPFNLGDLKVGQLLEVSPTYLKKILKTL